ncbi:hypothetical protein HZF08_35180 [Paenibacillus sp. CGMCC 1.16610]|uniref:YtkA-like domain-containing protein n=2 Tax=Paenibacillus anseongense TaxID=2682845 RepID=A0ABW9UMC0_9BACL|nr:MULTISPECIES: hypothetical protein [Paenibacillus]MBA2943519.1 hypothetical protein [Paenibacillus sp. CGMCC 1.16610]MVQ39670.1 hypothetical protein [Paenibacillus anseongense]
MRIMSLIVLSLVLVLSGCGKSQTTDHSVHSGGHEAGSSEEQIQAIFQVASPQAKAKAKEDTTLTIQIQDSDGKPINDFDLNHEKKMHLIAVSKDLSYYKHLHPEYNGKGLFTVSTQFPSGGEYRLFADFLPTGKEKTVKSYSLNVQGDPAPPVAIEPENAWTKTIDGNEVTLKIDHLMAGMELNLTYSFKDAASKAPIKDLQPYLGAVGHVVILDANADQYLHVHPTDEKSTGPEAQFMTTFPKSGVYKVWGEFQRGGKVFTVPFVVKVP